MKTLRISFPHIAEDPEVAKWVDVWSRTLPPRRSFQMVVEEYYPQGKCDLNYALAAKEMLRRYDTGKLVPLDEQ